MFSTTLHMGCLDLLNNEIGAHICIHQNRHG